MLQGAEVVLHLLPFCTASVSQLRTSCFSTLKAGPAAGSTPIDPAPSISASASHLSMAATAKLYSRSCTQTHLCAPELVICMHRRGMVKMHARIGSVRGRTSEPMADWFCHEAELLAEHLPLCYSNQESRQTPSVHMLQFCQRLLSKSEKRVKT